LTVTTAPSLWQLAGVEAQAFSRRNRRNAPVKVAFQAAMAIALGAFDRRVHPSGQAVCLLAPRWRRLVGPGLGGVVAAVLIGAAMPLAGWLLLASTALVCLPSAVRATRALPARVRLGRIGPPGHRHGVYVHSVASTRPGAGAELMASLAGEADQKDWLLYLDADNEELATYYSRFGFARGAAVRMPDGTVRVRMWRPPHSRRGRAS
jgi:hypothetical protein